MAENRPSAPPEPSPRAQSGNKSNPQVRSAARSQPLPAAPEAPKKITKERLREGFIDTLLNSVSILSEIAEMLSDRELRERLKTEPDAAGVHKLISDWEPLKSVA